ncbi:hypothetical protein [Bacillus bingmayongensis]|uniref:hypothetical protein n=1 Tax=Bacillus bingmayongensis TaxID=1150157 RepID=UPI0002EF4A52
MGRPSTKQLSSDDKLKKAEARIAFLEAELEFLKKLDELERQALKKNYVMRKIMNGFMKFSTKRRKNVARYLSK